MRIVTFHGGKKYYHDEYTTDEQLAALPKNVREIILKSRESK